MAESLFLEGLLPSHLLSESGKLSIHPLRYQAPLLLGPGLIRGHIELAQAPRDIKLGSLAELLQATFCIRDLLPSPLPVIVIVVEHGKSHAAQ
eukprot:CAMPEP_0180769504 /NCGR_PEP_ID=MMETSP1038_2-20121128/41138_1 /TAXON_ID=632150 /ORGANISM="Azadinium spinosum, Strain 3D9" /LENGTH=92 /DNA_ID=CAMNT_0022804235 /DNA_START=181 /DNA_END=459 /DNA_ORIENTATION=+